MVLEKLPWDTVQAMQGNRFIHAKQIYAISPASIAHLQIQSESMISYGSRKLGKRPSPKERWRALRGSSSASITAPPGVKAAESQGPADEAMSRALEATPAALISSDEEFFFRSSEFLNSNDPNERAFWLALGIEPPSALSEGQQE